MPQYQKDLNPASKKRIEMPFQVANTSNTGPNSNVDDDTIARHREAPAASAAALLDTTPAIEQHPIELSPGFSGTATNVTVQPQGRPLTATLDFIQTSAQTTFEGETSDPQVIPPPALPRPFLSPSF